MTPAAIVGSFVAGGGRIRARGQDLHLWAPAQPDACLLHEFRSTKKEVLEYLHTLQSWTEDDWKALFDERAAIMEYDGRLPRFEAEGKAAEEVRLLRSWDAADD